MTGVSYEAADSIITCDRLMRQEPTAMVQAREMYVKHQASPFTIGGVQSSAFIRVDVDIKDLSRDALVPSPVPVPVLIGQKDYNAALSSISNDPNEASANLFVFLAQANLPQGSSSFVGSQLHAENFISLGCSQSHRFSRGATHITSADAIVLPSIDPRCLSYPADLQVMALHLQHLERLHHSEHLAPFFKTGGKRNHPSALHIAELDKAKEYILDTAATTYHSCGTTAMLPKKKGGVVGNRLKVYGTTNMRIIDASIFLLIPRGNIMSSLYAVAERVADIIKSDG